MKRIRNGQNQKSGLTKNTEVSIDINYFEFTMSQICCHQIDFEAILVFPYINMPH